MLTDDGQPILMDFGSTIRARIKIENRQQALAQQVGILQINTLRFYLILKQQSTGSRCRTKHNAISRPRTIRRQNRYHIRRKSRYLGASLNAFPVSLLKDYSLSSHWDVHSMH